MTTGQTLVAAVLWVMALGLLALVLLLYRQVDRAYSGGVGRSGGLKPGVEIEPIEVIDETGPTLLKTPGGDERYLLAFLSLDCDGCRALVRTLGEGRAFSGPVMGVVLEGAPKGTGMSELPQDIPIYPAFAGAQLRRSFGVTVVPLLYVMRGNVVLASGSVAGEKEVATLLGRADENEKGLLDALVVTERKRDAAVGVGPRDG